MVKISVILTTYNLENIISKTLTSIIAQSFQDYELIVVDDGSNDSTAEIVEKYAQKFDFIKFYKLTHNNAGFARNFGFEKSCGKYIMFLDGDDIFDADFLYNMYQKIENEKADICICNSAEFVGIEKNIVKRHFHFDYPYGWAWDKIFKRNLIEKYNLKFSHLSSSNDLSFTFSAYFLAQKVVKIPDFLILRRIRENSTSSLRDEKNAFLALIELKENLIKFEKYNEIKDDFKNIALYFLFWHFNSYKTPSQKKKVIEYIKYFENEFDIIRLKTVKYKKQYNFYKCAVQSKNPLSFKINYLKLRFSGLYEELSARTINNIAVKGNFND